MRVNKKSGMMLVHCAMAVFSLAMTSCASTPKATAPADPETAGSMVPSQLNNQANRVGDEENASIPLEEINRRRSGDGQPAEPIEVRGSGDFIDTDRAAWRIDDTSPDGKGTVLNFDSADVQTVAKTILGDILGENYQVDPSISGKITLHTSRSVPRSALIPTLENVLRLNNLALSRINGVYAVVPESHAKTGVSSPRTRIQGQHGYQTLIMPLEFISAKSMAAILDPMKPQKAFIHSDTTRNIVVASGTQHELENILNTVRIYDVDQLKGMSVGIYPVEVVDAATVIDELHSIYAADSNNVLDGMLRLQAIDRLNAVMVVTSQSDYLDEIKEWIQRLDRVEDISGREMYVFYVEHGRAEHLAVLLSELFGAETDGQSDSTGSGSSDSSPSPLQDAGDSEVKKPSGAKTGSIKIVADDRNNSLLVLASRSDYAVVRSALRRLDIVPKQVLIEASILEVALTDELSYGLQWYFKNYFGTQYNATGELFPLDVTPSFAYTVSDSAGEVRGVLNALAADTRLRIVSSPSLLVQDNQTAVIRVGDEVPIRTSESTSLASSGIDPIVTSTIQYRDTGVLLEVLPRVNASGQVTMEISQEVNGVNATTSSGIDSPTIFQRSITTVVSVQSGDSIILGGLITESGSTSESGVPFISKVPVIGSLFGSKTNQKLRTELLVMITATAVQDEASARSVTEEMRRKMPALFGEAGESALLR